MTFPFLDQLPANAESDEAQRSLWAQLASRVDPAEHTPCQAEHIEVSQLSDRLGRYFVLKNTAEKTYYRLSEQEFNLWSQMDGSTSVQELVVEHFMQTGEFAHATVSRLVDQLHWHHMLRGKPIAFWRQLRTTVADRHWLNQLSRPARALAARRLNIGGLDRVIGLIYKRGGKLAFTRRLRSFFW